jgi:succinate dehydrogenase / fumarate reductase flavoprotein subunit
LCGELIARSALERKESRGQHNRDDYPQRDDANSLQWILMRRDGERIACSIEPIPVEATETDPSAINAAKTP